MSVKGLPINQEDPAETIILYELTDRHITLHNATWETDE